MNIWRVIVEIGSSNEWPPATYLLLVNFTDLLVNFAHLLVTFTLLLVIIIYGIQFYL
ncbi:hypothetical protein [Peribacillus simplex]|uniref:hypothetical protein n=1 Tax=Peribacillus simplex TaxID=1478 RepID=UPI003D2D76DB